MFEEPKNENIKKNAFGNRVHTTNRQPMETPSIGSSIEARETRGANNYSDKFGVRLTQDYKNLKESSAKEAEEKWKR